MKMDLVCVSIFSVIEKTSRYEAKTKYVVSSCEKYNNIYTEVNQKEHYMWLLKYTQKRRFEQFDPE